MGGRRNGHNILAVKLEGKRPLGRHGHRREDNIRTDFKETVCEVVDLIHMTQDSI
jgi:hypothetical protein